MDRAPNSIVKADEIERKPISKDIRTPDRDEAAQWITEMWPASLSNIADASGYSRQHISNTLKLYFREVDETNADQKTVERPQKPDSWEEGYRQGFRDGVAFATTDDRKGATKRIIETLETDG